MTTQNKPIRQSAEVWTKRLLSGPWGAATALLLDVPDPTDGDYDDLVRKATRKKFEEVENSLADSAVEPSEPADAENTPLNQWKEFRRARLAQLGKAHLSFSFRQFEFLLAGLCEQDRVQFARLEPEHLGNIDSYAVKELVESLKMADSNQLDLADFAFRTTFNQIASDLLALDRASVHHRVQQKTPISRGIRRADQLARNASETMADYLPEHLTVLTYIDRVANVRVVPYAPIALIGIPTTALVLARDLLAIAHEMGHFLYWNGCDKPLRGKSDSQKFHHKARLTYTDPFVLRWIEEIFADVAGCLIGGAAIALSFQDMALEKAGRLFLDESGRHPIPALRPFIYIRVLERMGLENAATALRGRWESVLTERLGGDWATRPIRTGDPASARMGEIQTRLNEITNTLCNWLDVNSANWGAERRSRVWSHGESVPTDRPDDGDWTELLYTEFETRLPLESLPDTDQITRFPMKQWEELVKDREYLETAQLDALKIDLDGRTESIPVLVPANQWLRVLLFDGWNTEGPGGGVPHLGG